MSYAREVLTFQVGNYSNFVGAHWLNIQEAAFSFNPNNIPDINNDVLFQEGRDLKGNITYTPRLISVDFQHGALIDEVVHPGLESGDVSKTEPLWDREKIELKTTGVGEGEGNDLLPWTKLISNPCFHPSSLNFIPQNLIPNLETFQTSSIWTSYYRNQLEDKIQTYMETCDNLQGFQILVDGDNCLFELGSALLEGIKEEYPKKSIFGLPLIVGGCEVPNFSRDSLRLINLTLGLNDFCSNCDLVAPMGLHENFSYKHSKSRVLKNLLYNTNNKIDSSSILAAALEGATLPYRMRSKGITFDEFVNSLNYNSRPLCSASINFPFPLGIVEELGRRWKGPLVTSLTPDIALQPNNINIQLLTFRGKQFSGPQEKLMASLSPLVINGFSSPIPTSFYVSTVNFRVPENFPLDFKPEFNAINCDANVVGRLKELCSVVGLHSTDEMQSLIEDLHSECRSVNIKKLPGFKLEELDYHNQLEKFLQHSKSYREEWDV